jgi:hypothetical protein
MDKKKGIILGICAVVVLCIAVVLFLVLGGSGKGKTVQTDRSRANITAGSGAVCEYNDSTYVLKMDGIYLNNKELFVAGSYMNICTFNDSLYAIKAITDSSFELVSIDFDTKEETTIKKMKADSLYLKNADDNKIYLSAHEKIFTVDQDGNTENTGYKEVLYVDSNGAFVPGDDGKGLSFVPSKDSKRKKFEIKELSDKYVSVWFVRDNKAYITVDLKPAYIDLDDESGKVNYVKFDEKIITDKVGAICLNYYDNNDKTTLLFGTSIFDMETLDEIGGEFYLYSIDVESGETKEINKQEGLALPLCWPSVIGDTLYIKSTDEVIAEEAIK